MHSVTFIKLFVDHGVWLRVAQKYIGINNPIMENEMDNKWKMKWRLGAYRGLGVSHK